MNLSEALDAALPEIPKTRLAAERTPRLDPELIIREDTLDGMPSISVLERKSATFGRLTPAQWQFLQLFDGVRSYEEIAAEWERQSGEVMPLADIYAFVETITECGFWYRDPQERNLAMGEKLAAERGRKVSRKSKLNLAHISFSAWDPNRYLTALDHMVGRYIYSRWFTFFAVGLFLFQGVVFAAKWKVIGPDIPLYYNFTQKSFADIAEFWLLFLCLGFIHESSHGLTCKHFGGEVHSMGLMFLYLAPAFYVDVTEIWVSATRWQRLATIIAGIWVELIACGIATIVWTVTQPGDWVHDFCYKIILLTGIAVVVINLNPLIKLDGYYFLTEWIRIPDLKERSTGFVSAWVQRHLFRMPVEMPVVARKRVLLFVLYAIASGLYSYMLLFVFLRFSYNVFSHWFAELALVPAALLAFLMFRSRLKVLRGFAGSFVDAHLRGGALRFTFGRAVAGVLLLALLFLPLWRDRANAYFVLEPMQTEILRAGLPGRVDAVYVVEGEQVHTGQILAHLKSLDEASTSSAARAQLLSTQADVFSAEIRHRGVGQTLAAEHGAEEASRLAQENRTALAITAPFDGVVVTGNPQSLAGTDVATGEALLALSDASQLIARLFIPASELKHVRAGDEVSLQLPSQFRVVHARLDAVDGEAVELPAGIVQSQKFKGMELPVFYAARVPVAGGAALRAGISGRAIVFGPRRSVAGRIAAGAEDFLRSHFW